MLCQFLWKEGNPEMKTADDIEVVKAYDDYRKDYCLEYIRTFFNQHIDDSWFRQMYSPLERLRRARKEQQRGRSEAREMKKQLEESLGSAAARSTAVVNATQSDGDDQAKCEFITSCRLGGGTRQPRYSDYDSVEKRLDQPLRSANKNAPNQKSSQKPNALPKSHTFSMLSRILAIHDVLPYVTNDQLVTALRLHCSLKSARSEHVELYSSSVSTQDLTRTAYFWCSEAMAQDILAQLNQLSRPSATHDAQSNHIPRKDDTHLPDFLELEVECSDVYGRSEIDADGKGGQPEEPEKIKPRKITVRVSTKSVSTDVKVLSASLSSIKRIPKDRQSAIELAALLDKKQRTPDDIALPAMLRLASLDNPESSQDVADSLDLAVAYLRRVHLVSFYGGCQRFDNFGDALNKNSAGSTVHLRLKNADEILEEAQARAVPNGIPPTSTAGTPGSSTAPEAVASSTAPADAAANVNVKTETDGPSTTKEQEKDLLEQRLDSSIEKAVGDLKTWLEANDNGDESNPILVDRETDQKGIEIESKEKDTEPDWLDNHTIIDEDSRARCSFHFCRKLFKDATFLRKHLLKKHSEYLKAERANCHDQYMMEVWDMQQTRPVPPILVNCGKTFGTVESTVLGTVTPMADDPEPELWKREEERRKHEEMEAAARRDRYEAYQRSRGEFDNGGGVNGNDGGFSAGDGGGSRNRNFVDVDDMKEEKVEMAFDSVPIEMPPPKKKKKKRKLL